MKKPSSTKSKKSSHSKKTSATISDQTKFIGLIVFCLALVGVTGAVAQQAREQRQHDQKAARRASEAMSAARLSFNSVSFDAVGMPNVWTPGEGKQFAMIDLTVVNQKADVLHFSPVSCLTLQDEAGTVYEVTSAPNLKSGLGGPIASGQSATGQVGFTVPVTVKGLKLHYRSHGSEQTLQIQ